MKLFTTITVPIEEFAVRLRSNSQRSDWRRHGPRRDDQIMARFCLRMLQRAGGWAIDDPAWSHYADSASTERQQSVVRCVRHSDPRVRERLVGIQVRKDATTIDLLMPAAMPTVGNIDNLP